MLVFRYVILALAGAFILGVVTLMGSMLSGVVAGRRAPNQSEKFINRVLSRIWWLALGIAVLIIGCAVVQRIFIHGQ